MQIQRYVQVKPESLANRNVRVVNTRTEHGPGRMVTGLLGKDIHIERHICFSLHDALAWLRPGQGRR